MAQAKDPHGEALALARTGRLAEALKVLQAGGGAADAPTLALMAGLHLELGAPEAAAEAARRALEADPQSARALAALADALQALGRAAEALAAYDRALALAPGQVAGHVNRGNLLLELGRPKEALESYDRALALDPKLAGAHANRARVLNELDRFEEGLAAADRAIALNPGHARAWVRRSAALMGLERFESALESYQTAAERDPAGLEARIGAAQALKALGRYAEAIAVLDAAEAQHPQAAVVRYERSLVRLLVGDFAQGWADYEARWATPVFIDNSNGFVTPALRARLALAPAAGDLAGRRVLVVAEQGIGDQLMHASLLPDLLGVARAVTWVCDRRLHRLLRASFPDVRFADLRDAPDLDAEGHDRVVASGSLAFAFRRTAADFPGTPYAAPGQGAVQAWAARLGSRGGRFRIGVSWRGGVKGTGQARRSMTLADLAPLLRRADCEVVSLQYGDVEAEAAEAARELGVALRIFPRAGIEDFEDLAGLVANLDLVVTVQTALAHLTGALGRPGLVLLPVRPEWRYGAQGETMPWYRSIRLLRQDARQAWAPVVDQAVRAVAAQAAKQA